MPKNSKETILVVGYDQTVRWTLRRSLTKAGFTPIEAGSVAEALLFNTELPAAVLLDIDLPDGSELDVLRQLKDEPPDIVSSVLP